MKISTSLIILFDVFYLSLGQLTDNSVNDLKGKDVCDSRCRFIGKQVAKCARYSYGDYRIDKSKLKNCFRQFPIEGDYCYKTCGDSMFYSTTVRDDINLEDLKDTSENSSEQSVNDNIMKRDVCDSECRFIGKQVAKCARYSYGDYRIDKSKLKNCFRQFPIEGDYCYRTCGDSMFYSTNVREDISLEDLKDTSENSSEQSVIDKVMKRDVCDSRCHFIGKQIAKCARYSYGDYRIDKSKLKNCFRQFPIEGDYCYRICGDSMFYSTTETNALN